jgi:hypothetical protein
MWLAEGRASIGRLAQMSTNDPERRREEAWLEYILAVRNELTVELLDLKGVTTEAEVIELRPEGT